mgnify:FL=1
MGYWDATDLILRANGGKNPICPVCKHEMYPKDDHGRFICGCKLLFGCTGGFASMSIPQVDTTGMTNEQKVDIPPINRLNSAPPEAEQRVLQFLARGPDCMDDPEYRKACDELEKERRQVR